MIRHLFAALFAAFALNAYAVDANQASRADLETVKGIGPALSARIVEARKAGEFRNWGDLVDRVGGVGTGNAARLSQAGLTVGGAAYDAAAMPAAPAKASRSAGAEKAAKSSAGEKPQRGTKSGS